MGSLSQTSLKQKISCRCSFNVFFSYFLEFFVYIVILCGPSEASTHYCAIPGGNPPKDWQSMLCAGKELDWNSGLLICCQVLLATCWFATFELPLLRRRSRISSLFSHLSPYWATFPPKLSHLSSYAEPPLLLSWANSPPIMSHLSYVELSLLLRWATSPPMLSHLSS